jgi:hypothetical protein
MGRVAVLCCQNPRQSLGKGVEILPLGTLCVSLHILQSMTERDPCTPAKRNLALHYDKLPIKLHSTESASLGDALVTCSRVLWLRLTRKRIELNRIFAVEVIDLKIICHVLNEQLMCFFKPIKRCEFNFGPGRRY